MRRRTPLSLLLAAGALAASLLLGGCAGTPTTAAAPQASAPLRLDDTPRVAVMSAFEPELALLRQRVSQPGTHTVNGVEFTTGTLQGQPVVLLLSGVSMTNAAMNTQLVLDRFHVRALVFSGIAGGVNPALHIGDVAVPQQWGPYLELLVARETAPGQYAPPPHMKDPLFPNFGALFPRTVGVRSAAQPQVHRQFWFAADPAMLAAARQLRPSLSACAAGQCLKHTPQLVVGGNGVSGSAFMDNAALRQYTFQTFHANVLDMETAAVAQVAYSNGVPYLAFRSLSDLAGGGEGANEMGTFMGIAADNAAQVLLAFLAAWRP